MSDRFRSSRAEASTLKTLSIVLAFTAAIGMVLGSAGFSATDADRGVEVSVVDDEEAYLGVETVGPVVANESSTAVVYENGFDAELTDLSVNVVSTDPGVDVVVADAPERLDAGESAPVDVVVESESVGLDSVEIQLAVTASGEGVSIETSRTSEYDLITGGDAVEVVFSGGGNAEIHGPSGVFPLDVEVDTTDGDTVELEVTESGQTIRDGNVTGQIETVRIPAFGIERENPRL